MLVQTSTKKLNRIAEEIKAYTNTNKSESTQQQQTQEPAQEQPKQEKAQEEPQQENTQEQPQRGLTGSSLIASLLDDEKVKNGLESFKQLVNKAKDIPDDEMENIIRNTLSGANNTMNGNGSPEYDTAVKWIADNVKYGTGAKALQADQQRVISLYRMFVASANQVGQLQPVRVGNNRLWSRIEDKSKLDQTNMYTEVFQASSAIQNTKILLYTNTNTGAYYVTQTPS